MQGSSFVVKCVFLDEQVLNHVWIRDHQMYVTTEVLDNHRISTRVIVVAPLIRMQLITEPVCGNPERFLPFISLSELTVFGDRSGITD